MFDNKFISFEGLSGVGKSTISRLYAEKIDAKLIGTIPEQFSSLRKILDTPTTNIHARFLFYLAAVLEGRNPLKLLCVRKMLLLKATYTEQLLFIVVWDRIWTYQFRRIYFYQMSFFILLARRKNGKEEGQHGGNVRHIGIV